MSTHGPFILNIYWKVRSMKKIKLLAKRKKGVYKIFISLSMSILMFSDSCVLNKHQVSTRNVDLSCVEETEEIEPILYIKTTEITSLTTTESSNRVNELTITSTTDTSITTACSESAVTSVVNETILESVGTTVQETTTIPEVTELNQITDETLIFQATYYMDFTLPYKGSSGRELISGYSVASNYFPQGSILYIESDYFPSGEYRVDDCGGMADNVLDMYYVNYNTGYEEGQLTPEFKNAGRVNVMVTLIQ